MKEDGIPEPYAISKAERGVLDGLNSSVDSLCFSIWSIQDIPERLSPSTPLGRILPAPQL